MNNYQDPTYVQPVLRFLEKIGIPFQLITLNTETHLPGILIENGSLQIDLEKLSFPGDLLYEAGRIAY